MSDRMTLFFEPLDVLQFRDNRPFDAGFNVLGQSVFPLPGVFLGCVRAALFRRFGADFATGDDHFGITEPWQIELVGSRKQVGSLRLRGPLLARRPRQGEIDPLHPYYPMPADLVAVNAKARGPGGTERACIHYTVLARAKLDREDGPRFYHRGPKASVEAASVPTLPWTPHESAKPTRGPLLLTGKGARKYRDASLKPDGALLDLTLGNAECPEDAVRQNELMINENRFGITRDARTLTVVPERFYLLRPFRLARHHGFAVEVECPENQLAKQALCDLDGRAVRLGGRGHRARITVFDRGLLVPADLAPGSGQVGKLWFVTPAPLALPDARAAGSWPSSITVVSERVRAAGGFDQARRQPRPLVPILPAGAVVHTGARTMDQIVAELCGFRDRWPDDKPDEEIRRLHHAGFAMALHAGAERGAR